MIEQGAHSAVARKQGDRKLCQLHFVNIPVEGSEARNATRLFSIECEAMLTNRKESCVRFAKMVDGKEAIGLLFSVLQVSAVEKENEKSYRVRRLLHASNVPGRNCVRLLL